MLKAITIKKIVTHVMRGAIDRQIVLSPLVWRPGKRGSKEWYFSISTAGRAGWRADMIVLDEPDQEAGELARLAVKSGFLEKRPLVIHDCDDELYAARLCETLWPGERITAVREGIEAEQRG